MNAMKCTEILIQDHVLIRRTLDIVDGMLKKLKDGQRIEISDAKAVLKFLRSFGDQYHQTLEETVLFPALLLAAPGDSSLHQLISEHGGDDHSLMRLKKHCCPEEGWHSSTVRISLLAFS